MLHCNIIAYVHYKKVIASSLANLNLKFRNVFTLSYVTKTSITETNVYSA